MSGLIVACASSGQLKRAWQTWLILTAKGLLPDLVAHNALLAALAAAGAAAEALEVYRSMKVGEVRASAYLSSCWWVMGTSAFAAQLSSCIALSEAVPATDASAEVLDKCGSCQGETTLSGLACLQGPFAGDVQVKVCTAAQPVPCIALLAAQRPLQRPWRCTGEGHSWQCEDWLWFLDI